MSHQFFHHFLLHKFFSLCSTDSQMWSFSNFQSVLMPPVCYTWWLTVSLEWFLLGARVSFSNACLLQWEYWFDLWEMSFSEHIVRSCSRLLNSTPMSVSPFFRHRPPGQPSLTNIYQYKKCQIYIILKVQVKLCVFTIFASGYTNVTITRSKMSPENVSQPSGQPSHCEPHPWLRFQNHTKGCATLIVRVKVHMD